MSYYNYKVFIISLGAILLASCFDQSDSTTGNTDTATNTTEDTTAPVITLKGKSTVFIKIGESYSDEGATATDDTDGDISNQITIANDSIDTSSAGSFSITYDVTDAAGNSAQQVTRTVYVLDFQKDTDNDGVISGMEVLLGSDPVDQISLPTVSAALGHTDGKGVALSNAIFTDGGNNDTGAYGLESPSAIAIDSINHYLFVADYGNDRIMVFQLDTNNHINSRKAVAVIGQADLENNNSGTSQSEMDSPSGLDFYNDGSKSWLLVAEEDNHRVMIYDLSAGVVNGMSASLVLGQADFISGKANRGGSTSGCYLDGTGTDANYGKGFLNRPKGVRVIKVGTRTLLVISDTDNNRLLLWDISINGISGLSNGQGADYVLGQPDFNHQSSDACGSTAANTLDDPREVAIWNNILWVSDEDNDRVIGYDLGTDAQNLSNNMAATYLLGQADFSSSKSNRGAATPAANSFNNPRGLALLSNKLYVVDSFNHRAVAYDLSNYVLGMNASQVFGNSNFTSSLAKASQSTMDGPVGIAINGSGDRLFVAEVDSDRVLSFNASSTASGQSAVNIIGQTDWYPGKNDALVSGIFDANGSDDTNAVGLHNPKQVAFGSVQNTNYLFVADNYNDRVMVFETDSSGTPLNLMADHVLGQADFEHDEGALDINSLNSVDGVAFDQSTKYLFVSDGKNNRIMVWDLSNGISKNMDASYVIGQADMNSGSVNRGTGPGNNSLNNPKKLTIATLSNKKYLIVADSGNGRVLLYDLSNGVSTDMAATYYLGKPSFVTLNNGTTRSQSTLLDPHGTSVDEAKQLLFVADGNAVLIWDLSSGIQSGMLASYILGQPAFDTNATSPASADRLNGTVDVAWDKGRSVLWLADGNNNRILGFDISTGITTGASADYVFGQTDYNGNSSVSKGRNASTVNDPESVSLTYDGKLVVTSGSDDRVIIYQ